MLHRAGIYRLCGDGRECVFLRDSNAGLNARIIDIERIWSPYAVN